MQTFQNLFTAAITNGYYRQLTSEDFVFRPTTATKQLMRKYGLLLRTDPSGITVLCAATGVTLVGGSSDTVDYLANRGLELDFQLTFWVQLKRSTFANYTDVPMEDTTEVYYYTNVGKRSGGVPGDLPSDEKVALRPRSFQYTSESDPIAEVKVVDVFGNTVINAQLPVSPPTYIYQVDLSRQPEGVYTLFVNGQQIQQFYAIGLALRDQPFGVLNITNFNIQTSSNQLVSKDRVLTPENYAIQYAARNTLWQYVVVNQSNKIELSWPAVTNEALKKVFDGPSHVTLPNGQQGWTFISQDILELQDVSPYVFQLWNNFQGADDPGTLLYKQLPAPKVENLKPAPAGEPPDTMLSEIYVYL
ncbi:MAG: hypothetical protein AAGB22_10170 [Bacteroidota bacterium]